MEKCVLIVDDERINRQILMKLLQHENYRVLEAEDGQAALDILNENYGDIAAVILDLMMPRFNGYDFLKEYEQSKRLRRIPIIVSTGEETSGNEAECLKLGAWDFIKKPYQRDVLLFRLKNVIERSNFYLLQEIRRMEQFDSLTGIYKKGKFVESVRELLDANREIPFAIIRLDIYNFQMYNSFFGRADGDRLLKYMAESVKEMNMPDKMARYCRTEADIFYIIRPFKGMEEMKERFEQIRMKLNQFRENYNMMPNLGVFLVEGEEQRKMDVLAMMDCAKLASKKCKGNYIRNFEVYDDRISNEIIQEQNIVNSMNEAMEQEQFVLYIQPKYELINQTLEGGEILIRWRDSEGNMISPGAFIPIFEKNGFIMNLDYYVWDHACQLLRKWLDEGKEPFPVSVNISRVSLYNPNLVEIICGLVEKYKIEPALLQLELTESAYTSNPTAIREAMTKLQKQGFAILMDDFGSGYSSLNALKDIAVDVLKIDMKFMEKSDIPGRSENILASVIRMAKWLNMPVIAEGVEEKDQVDFLRGVGCEFVQGYYFAKPMPIEEYEKLAFERRDFLKNGEEEAGISADTIWAATSQLEHVFSNMIQAVAVYEFDGEHISAIRVNNAYYDIFGFANYTNTQYDCLKKMDAENAKIAIGAFQSVAQTKDMIECECKCKKENADDIWVHLKLRFMNETDNKTVIFGMISDVTQQKEMDMELQKYRLALKSADDEEQTLLIVDDIEMNREILKAIFENDYHLLEAADGREALEILREHPGEVSLILLDMMMPVMDGWEFLEIKEKEENIHNIPVVVITAENAISKQRDALSRGVSDYVLKPFVPEVVRQRVKNVLHSSFILGSTASS